MAHVPEAPLLHDAEIAASLAELRGWERRGQAIAKTFHLSDFAGALAFVNRIAEPAEQQNHHPDVTIHWNLVTLSLWTHASGGLTERDFRLARTIDEMTED